MNDSFPIKFKLISEPTEDSILHKKIVKQYLLLEHLFVYNTNAFRYVNISKIKKELKKIREILNQESNDSISEETYIFKPSNKANLKKCYQLATTKDNYLISLRELSILIIALLECIYVFFSKDYLTLSKELDEEILKIISESMDLVLSIHNQVTFFYQYFDRMVTKLNVIIRYLKLASTLENYNGIVVCLFTYFVSNKSSVSKLITTMKQLDILHLLKVMNDENNVNFMRKVIFHGFNKKIDTLINSYKKYVLNDLVSYLEKEGQ